MPARRAVLAFFVLLAATAPCRAAPDLAAMAQVAAFCGGLTWTAAQRDADELPMANRLLMLAAIANNAAGLPSDEIVTATRAGFAARAELRATGDPLRQAALWDGCVALAFALHPPVWRFMPAVVAHLRPLVAPYLAPTASDND